MAGVPWRVIFDAAQPYVAGGDVMGPTSTQPSLLTLDALVRWVSEVVVFTLTRRNRERGVCLSVRGEIRRDRLEIRLCGEMGWPRSQTGRKISML